MVGATKHGQCRAVYAVWVGESDVNSVKQPGLAVGPSSQPYLLVLAAASSSSRDRCAFKDWVGEDRTDGIGDVRLLAAFSDLTTTTTLPVTTNDCGNQPDRPARHISHNFTLSLNFTQFEQLFSKLCDLYGKSHLRMKPTPHNNKKMGLKRRKIGVTKWAKVSCRWCAPPTSPCLVYR